MSHPGFGALSVALKHAIHKISKRTPVVSSTSQAVLVNKEHILLEARVQMRLKAKLSDDRVVMTVDVCIDSIHALEDLTH